MYTMSQITIIKIQNYKYLCFSKKKKNWKSRLSYILLCVIDIYIYCFKEIKYL